MILGIGFDMVEVDRLDSWAENNKIIDRYFHITEVEDMKKQDKLKAQSLAARFAAKEAFGKALGTGISGFEMKDLRIISGKHGKPELLVGGKARDILESHGGGRIYLSLSHEKTYAGAVVVIERL